MRIGVICDEQEVRLIIQTTEFCSFLSDEEEYFGQPYKRLCYNNQCGNVYTKAFANVLTADIGMKLRIWRYSRSLRKLVFKTAEICLSISLYSSS